MGDQMLGDLFFYGNPFQIALPVAPLRAFAGYLCILKQLLLSGVTEKRLTPWVSQR